MTISTVPMKTLRFPGRKWSPVAQGKLVAEPGFELGLLSLNSGYPDLTPAVWEKQWGKEVGFGVREPWFQTHALPVTSCSP